MKKVFLAVLLAALVGLAPRAMAQQKPKAEGGEKQTEVKKEITPVRVQVVFSEFEGEKKISSWPYTMLINAVEGGQAADLFLRSEEHTSELQSHLNLVCRLLLEKTK